MANEVCYWDSIDEVQKTRDATPDELAAMDVSRVNGPAYLAKGKAVDTFKAALSALEAAYPQKERDTWPQQVIEARAYLADNLAATPLLDAMLTTKPNTTKAVLVGKIMTNYTAYSALVGAALGQMQTTLDGLA